MFFLHCVSYCLCRFVYDGELGRQQNSITQCEWTGLSGKLPIHKQRTGKAPTTMDQLDTDHLCFSVGKNGNKQTSLEWGPHKNHFRRKSAQQNEYKKIKSYIEFCLRNAWKQLVAICVTLFSIKRALHVRWRKKQIKNIFLYSRHDTEN